MVEMAGLRSYPLPRCQWRPPGASTVLHPRIGGAAANGKDIRTGNAIAGMCRCLTRQLDPDQRITTAAAAPKPGNKYGAMTQADPSPGSAGLPCAASGVMTSSRALACATRSAPSGGVSTDGERGRDSPHASAVAIIKDRPGSRSLPMLLSPGHCYARSLMMALFPGHSDCRGTARRSVLAGVGTLLVLAVPASPSTARLVCAHYQFNGCHRCR